MKDYIIGIGEVLWDMLPSGKQLGGAPANFAYHVSRLGLPAKVVSAVGKDGLGDEIQTLFQEKEISSQLSFVDYPTGTVQVSLDESGVPSYEIKENVAWDNLPFTSDLEELAHQTRVVCFGSLAQRSEQTRTTIYRFIDAMPQNSQVLKIFDINLRQQFYSKELLHESLCKSNVLKINDEELSVVSLMFGLEKGSVEYACRQLLSSYNLKMLILTCGEQGSYVFTSDATSYLDTPRVEVIDTVGAGDAFTAAFIAGLLRGKTIPEAHQQAVDVAAYVCTQAGAMPR